MASTLYRWDDAGAPKVYGVSNSVPELLKACLVDGYGSKAGLGWTVEFEDATAGKIVFRNNSTTGTGTYLRVVHHSGDSYCYGGRTAYLQGYESMADIDNGVNGCCNTAATMAYIQASSTTTTVNARPWILVGDDRAFHLVIFYSESNGTSANSFVSPVWGVDSAVMYSRHCFVGDFDTYATGDTKNFAIIASNSQSSYDYFGQITALNGTTKTGHHALCSMDGTTYNTGFIVLQTLTSITSFGGASYSNIADWNEGLILNDCIINNGVANTIRGKIPGVAFPSTPDPWGWFETFTHEGKTYFGIKRHAYSTECRLAFIIGEGFRD